MSWSSGVEVDGPGARRWRVRRRWVPRLGPETLWGRFRRRTREARRRMGDLADVPDVGCIGDLLEGVVVAIAAIIVVVVLVVVVIPLLAALVEIVALILLALLAVLARILFRRPWIVEASHAEPPIERALRWKVVGWRASAERCAEIAQALEAGIIPTDGTEVDLPTPEPNPTAEDVSWR